MIFVAFWQKIPLLLLQPIEYKYVFKNEQTEG